jgi:hypothetical protein
MSEQLKDLILTIEGWAEMPIESLVQAVHNVAASPLSIEQAKASLLLQEQKRSIYSTNAARWNEFARTLDQWDGSGPIPEL